MDNLFFHSFVLLGACFILKYGTILNFVRNPVKNFHPKLKELFECSLCLGFWIGVVFGLFADGSILSWAFYSSAVCWVGDHLLDIMDKYSHG